MPSSHDIQMLMRNSGWANTKLYESLARVPPEIISAPRPGRPAGLNGALAHFYVVDLIWKAHLEGTHHGFKTRNLDRSLPLAQLSAAQAMVDQWYIDYVNDLSEAALARVVDFQMGDPDPSGVETSFSMW